jgi:hypothetical protein
VVRTELHLVDGRDAGRGADEAREPVATEVADANRPGLPAFL